MNQDVGKLAYYVKEIHNTRDDRWRKAPRDIMERLEKRLQLCHVALVEQCNVIFVFVLIGSRVGTDLDRAITQIQNENKPVILFVLHATFEDRVVPQSRLHVSEDKAFCVDCLFNEDEGLLRCQRNDEALKAVTDHLIQLGASPSREIPSTRSLSDNFRPLCDYRILMLLLVVILVIVILSIIFYNYPLQAYNSTGDF